MNKIKNNWVMIIPGGAVTNSDGSIAYAASLPTGNFIPQIPRSKPTEETAKCPNCGELNYKSELCYSSVYRSDAKTYSFCSHLYGVCQKCANNHESPKSHQTK